MKITMALAASAMLAVSVGAVGTAPVQAHISDGAAVGVGILGLGVGAAIASHPHYHRYYDGGYYAPPPPTPVYYAPPPAYSYEYVQRCRVFERWNPYWGRYQQVRRCY